MKKMKFERKAARKDRSMANEDSEVMPPPGEPEPIAAPVQSQGQRASRRQPTKQSVPEPAKIPAYVRSFDLGRLRSAIMKGLETGAIKEDQVDDLIDSALPSQEEAQSLPFPKLMAVASMASDAKRQEYKPLLMAHAQHAQQLPDNERGQINDHLQLLGMLQQEAQ